MSRPSDRWGVLLRYGTNHRWGFMETDPGLVIPGDSQETGARFTVEGGQATTYTPDSVTTWAANPFKLDQSTLDGPDVLT